MQTTVVFDTKPYGSEPLQLASAGTRTGTTARLIARYHAPAWIVALSRDEAVCRGLASSYGVEAAQLAEEADNWCDFARQWLSEHGVSGAVAMLAAGPSARNANANHRIEFFRVGDGLTAPRV